MIGSARLRQQTESRCQFVRARIEVDRVGQVGLLMNFARRLPAETHDDQSAIGPFEHYRAPKPYANTSCPVPGSYRYSTIDRSRIRCTASSITLIGTRNHSRGLTMWPKRSGIERLICAAANTL